MHSSSAAAKSDLDWIARKLREHPEQIRPVLWLLGKLPFHGDEPVEREDPGLAELRQDRLPASITRGGLLTRACYMHYLPLLEPTRLSSQILAGCQPKLLQELFSACTGHDRQGAMLHRIPEHMHEPGVFTLRCQRCNEARNRPCREIPIPPHWPRDGLYQLS